MSAAQPALSVVVPNYNHARYLRAALLAHLEQTRPPLEVIVVDDASTDESVAVVDDLARAHPSLRLIRLAQNGGVNAAMNRGLRETSGDYVCFSAADDRVTAEFAAHSVKTLAQYPAAAFCFSDFAERVGDTDRVDRRSLHVSDGQSFLPPARLRQLFKRGWFVMPGFVVYRRGPLVVAGGFAEDLHWLADWFTNGVLGFRHGACYVPEVLNVIRILPESYCAAGIRRTDVQRALTYRVVDLLQSPVFRDVAPSFRECGLVPDYRVGVLMWLVVSPPHRRYLTPRLVVKVAVRRVWKLVQPYTPGRVRRVIRRVAGRWANVWRPR